MKTIIKHLFFAVLIAGTTAPAYAAQYAHYGRKAADTALSLGKISLISGACAWACANLLDYVPVSEDSFKKRRFLTNPPPLVEDFVREMAKREKVENPSALKVYASPDYGGTASALRPDKYSQYICLNRSVADDLSLALSVKTRQSELTKYRAILTHEMAHLRYNHPKKRKALAIFSAAFFIQSFVSSQARLVANFSTARCLIQLVRNAIYIEFWYLACIKHGRLLEFEADDAITHPDEIRASIEFYKRRRDDKPPDDPLEFLKYTVESIHKTHPHYYERIERFEKRLQESE